MYGKPGVYIRMFEQTFVTNPDHSRKPLHLAVSLTVQCLAVAVLLVIPLLQTAHIAWTPPLVLYSPPRVVPPAVMQPAMMEQEMKSTAGPTAPQRAVFRPAFTAPARIPATIATGITELPAPALPAGVPGITTGWVDLSFNGAGAIAAGQLPRAPVAAAPAKSGPIRASAGVQQALLVHQVKPPYPPLARSSRISGTVRLTAVIAIDGTIQKLQVVSGHPLLVQAALEAVRQWRYKPTLLSNQPVEVITEIDVNFNLSN